ncbi:MAG: serine/threonine-protein kinase [Polyangiaceae bacterium]
MNAITRANDVRTKTIGYASPGAAFTATADDRAATLRRVSAKGTLVTNADATLVDPRTASRGPASAAPAHDAFAQTIAAVSAPPSIVGPSSITPSAKQASVRVTVLPRVEVIENVPRIVQAERTRYEPEGKLGEGGLGEVTRALDQDIGRRVAVKRLKSDVKSDEHLVRFADEVRTVGQLEHPNIVPIHDVGVDENGDHYFVMKYVEGETLEDIIEKLAKGDPGYHARFTVERRVELFVQLLEAVAFAHAKGIVHRDIKPANVMVGRYGEVMLMDWGIAKTLDKPEPLLGRVRIDGHVDPHTSVTTSLHETVAGSLVGTPFYMSPEQAAGKPVDHRSDIYSLSMLFRELLLLTHPLESKRTIDEVLKAVIEEPVPSMLEGPKNAFQESPPAELTHIVKKGVAKDPAERFQSVGEMLDRFRARAMGKIPVQCPVTFMKRSIAETSRFVDRHPFVAMSLATLVAAMAIALVVLGVVGAKSIG